MDRRALAKDAFAGWPSRGGSPRTTRARSRLARLVWRADGSRRVPSLRGLDEALKALPRGELDWICELSPLGPIYLLPNTRWLKALAEEIRRLKPRRVVEVAAGDGFLSRALRPLLPEVEIIATDSGAWEKPQARMNARERRELARIAVPGLVPGEDVVRMDAGAAIRRFKPDLVLASWLPPGPLLDRLIRSDTKYVLEIGAAGGVTSGAWSWRFAHEFIEGPVEQFARCRLDERPRDALHTRVTLYYGKKHPEHTLERVRPGDWLWQYRPRTKKTGRPR